MKIEQVPISEIRAAPYNPRKDLQPGDPAYERLKRSIEEFGLVDPLVWNKMTGNLVGGHQRLKVLKARGDKTAEVVVVELDLKREQTLNLALNKVGGEWDIPALKEILVGLDDGAFDLTLTGFDDDELRRLVEGGGQVDPDALPRAAKAVSRVGSLWRMGDHRLLCADSGDARAVSRVVGDGVDLIVTSPPYNCKIKYSGYDDDLPVENYLGFMRRVIDVCASCLRSGKFVAWNIGVTPKSRHFDHARMLSETGLEFYRQIVWAKIGVAFPIWQHTIRSRCARKYHPNFCHELIYLFSKGLPELGARCDVDEAYSSDVWTVHQSQSTRGLPGRSNGRKPRKSGVHVAHKLADHPAIFPVGIPLGAVKHLTAPGELVYDPFVGSGTTIIAAEITGRRAIGVEKDPTYCDLAVARWEKFTGKKAVLEKS